MERLDRDTASAERAAIVLRRSGAEVTFKKEFFSMTQIFVGNLPYGTSEYELRSTFERFGRVSSVKLVTDPQTGKPRGFAFVGMSRWDDADEAITRLNGASLAGRQIIVNEANAKTNPTQRQAPASNNFWDRL